MDLRKYGEKPDPTPFEKIIPWSSDYLVQTAEMSMLSYRNQIDAEICEDYCSKDGCESYLRSLVENPGCGYFMPEASFMALDKQGAPCGFLICSRISSGTAMVPQVAVHPAYQGRGVGNALMTCTIDQLKALGFRSLSLTVTKKNRRAFEWYQRVGFRIRKDFGAYIWNRT
jgi:ribosomal protein S18 acetylase RimI-like enzyme